MDLAICGGPQASGIENVRNCLALVALSEDLFAVQLEGDTGGVSCFDDDLVGGADRGVRRCYEGFAGGGFAVNHQGDPSSLVGADLQGESAGRLRNGGVGDSRFEV